MRRHHSLGIFIIGNGASSAEWNNLFAACYQHPSIPRLNYAESLEVADVIILHGPVNSANWLLWKSLRHRLSAEQIVIGVGPELEINEQQEVVAPDGHSLGITLQWHLPGRPPVPATLLEVLQLIEQGVHRV